MKSPTAAGAGRAGNVFALEDAITAAAGALVGGLKHGDRATSFTSGALFVGASEANAGSPAAGTFLRGVLPVRVNHGLSRAGCSSTFTRKSFCLFASPPDARYHLEDQKPLLKLDPITPASPPDVKYRLEDKEPSLKLDPITPASPPDVKYRLEDKEPPLKLDSLNSGFAAGCEAGLRPAVSLIYLGLGYAPRSGYAHK